VDGRHVADVVWRDVPLHEIGPVGDQRFDDHRLTRIKRDLKGEMERISRSGGIARRSLLHSPVVSDRWATKSVQFCSDAVASARATSVVGGRGNGELP
jgi:hypothetical protein